MVGIVETVSDRWDVGDTALPNCYLSEATAGELRDTLSYLETKDAPRLYRLPEEQKLLFLRGSRNGCRPLWAGAGNRAAPGAGNF